jgi:hypothetical protein
MTNTEITATADLTEAIRAMLVDYREQEGGYSDGTIIVATRADNDAEEIARMVAAEEMDAATAGHYLAVAQASGEQIVAAWANLDALSVQMLTEDDDV